MGRFPWPRITRREVWRFYRSLRQLDYLAFYAKVEPSRWQ